MKKRIISLILIIIMAVGLFPSTAFASNVISGSCGEAAAWSLDRSSGVFTVSGSGEMDSYGSIQVPWRNLRDEIRSVVIAEGITSVGRFALGYCENLQNVSLPQSLTSIGEAAFISCTALSTINIPAGVTTIDDMAFLNCQELRESKGFIIVRDTLFGYHGSSKAVTIPEGVQRIGSEAFSYNDTVESVHIPDGVTKLGGCIFEYCSALKSVRMPQQVTEMGGELFKGCIALTSAKIPAGATEISSFFFYNCVALKSVKLPNSVAGIGTSAFDGCSALSSVNIPTALTHLGTCAFERCAKLTSVSIPQGVKEIPTGAFKNSGLETIRLPKGLEYIGPEAFSYTALDTIEIPEGVTEIGAWAFSYTAMKSIKFPKTLTKINEYAFVNSGYLKKIYITDLAAWCKVEFSGVLSHPFSGGFNSTVDGAGKIYLNNKLITDLKIPDGVESIGRLAFNRCDAITSVTIPDGVTSIGGGAFLYCGNIKTLTIADSVAEIGDSAFSGCHSLKRLKLPAGMTKVEELSFWNDWEVVYIPKGIKNFEENALGPYDIAFVYYEGTEADRKAITVGDVNEWFENATWVYNAKGLPKETAKMFKDVSAGDWYEHYVDYAVTYGLFSGTSKTTFSPNKKVTRAQFVQVLAALSGVDTSNNNVKSGFSDVPKGQWYTAAVKWASQNGIVSGNGNGKFAPDANVTREQMCVMLVSYAKYRKMTLKKLEAKATFADHKKISSWARDAVYACQRADFVNGKSGNQFDPKGTGTRAEAAVMFTKFHKDY